MIPVDPIRASAPFWTNSYNWRRPYPPCAVARSIFACSKNKRWVDVISQEAHLRLEMHMLADQAH